MFPLPYPRTRPFALLILCLLLSVRSSEALMMYGRTNSENTTSPAAALPWDYVARTPSATAIYLGNGYFSMAGHVGTIPSSLVIAGVTYTRDTSFSALQLVTGSDAVDVKLYRLTSVPPLPPLPIMIKGADSDLGQAATIVGWGRGKGTAVTNGWNWGDASTVAKRWGTNAVASSAVGVVPFTGYDFTYAGLRISTNSNKGDDEAGLCYGDSGCALFQADAGGGWRLSGSGTLSSDPLIFRSNDNFSSECQFVRMAEYAHLLRFENWKQKYLGDSAADDLGDANGDGVPYLVEYALGIDPNGAPLSGTPVVGYETGYLTITYSRLLSAVDVNVTVEESTDQVAWTTATIASEVNLGQTDMVRTVKARVSEGTAGRKFLRVRVEKVE